MQCYLCGSERYFRREGKVRDNPSIEILECESCGLVFLSEQSTSDEFYAQGGMHNQQQVYELTGRKDFINDMYKFNRSRLEFVLDSLIGKDIVDFGSGYGGFLIQAKPFAKSVLGIELESQVKPVYERYGIPLASSLEEAFAIAQSCQAQQQNHPDKTTSGGGNYDLLTAFHVIEHLADPIGILRQLASLLKDNGKMIIEVPNANDALLTIYKNKAFSEFTYWSPHLYLYNPHTLRKLGQKAGLAVDFVKCVQRYPLSNTLHWLSNGLPAGQKIWGGFYVKIQKH